jgi:hypothetical protein
MPARQAILSAIAASTLVLGQLTNFGNASDPEEAKRGEKMVSQNERMISLSKIAIGIAGLALVISLFALLVSLWSTFHQK